MRFFLAILFVLALGGVLSIVDECAVAAGTRTLIEAGGSPYSIVYSPDDPPIVGYAARELQIHLRRMTGVELPICTEPVTPAIILRDDPTLPPSGFRVSWEKDDLVIAGHNTRTSSYPVVYDGKKLSWGTLNGVTYLLEMQGCRWYWPGPLGEIIPHREVISVGEDVIERSPAFRYRSPTRGLCVNWKWDQATGQWIAATGNDTERFNRTWAGRAGLGNDDGDAHNHNWRTIMGNKDGEVNPWAEPCPAEPPVQTAPLRCGHPEYLPLSARQNPTHWDVQAMVRLIEEKRRLCCLPELDVLVTQLLGEPYHDVEARITSDIYVPEPGERVLKVTTNTQVCTSNPGTVRAFVDYIDYALTRDPNIAVYSISMNDGSGGFCNCVNCRAMDGTVNPFDLFGDLDGDRDVDEADVELWRALDPEKQAEAPLDRFTMTGSREDDSVWRAQDCMNAFHRYGNAALHGGTPLPYMSDRIIDFYNKVAAGVAERHPDKIVEGYLYGQSGGIPRRPFVQHPNLRFCVVFNNCWLSSMDTQEGNARLLDGLLEKGARRGGITVYDIGGWKSYGTPQPMSQQLVRRAKMLRDRGVIGEYTYMGVSPEHYGYEMYLWSRLLWDPDLDEAALRQRYFADLYGPEAGPYIDRMYQSFERLRIGALEHTLGVPGRAGCQGLPPVWQLTAATFPHELRLKTFANRIDGFIATATDPQIKQRLESLKANQELTYGLAGALHALLRIYNGEPNAVDLAEYKRCVDLYQAQLIDLYKRFHVNSYIDAWWDFYNDPWFKPLNTGFGVYQLASRWPSSTKVVLWEDAGFTMTPYAPSPHYFVKSSRPGKDDFWMWTDASRNARIIEEDGSRFLRAQTGNGIALYLGTEGVDRYLKDVPVQPAVVHLSCKVRTRGLEDWTTYGALWGDFRIYPHGSSAGEFKAEYRRPMKASECQDWRDYDGFVYLPASNYWWSHSFHRAAGSEIDVKDCRVTYYLLEGK